MKNKRIRHGLTAKLCWSITLFTSGLCTCLLGGEKATWETPYEELLVKGRKIVLNTKRIYLHDYPDAQNPSIIKTDEGFLLVFRYCPDRWNQPWISLIGVARLNEAFDLIGQPEILTTRGRYSRTPSQSEDPRIFTYRGKNYIIYNDNVEVFDPCLADRRDMFMVQLYENDHHFKLSPPIKLHHVEKYRLVNWQKNWVPFEYDKKLFFNYSIHPHEVVTPDLTSGTCYTAFNTQPSIKWVYGTLRGSTPPVLVDGEYLSFFHSGMPFTSESSYNQEMWHYFMGAYTFSAVPPFNMTAMTPEPIVTDSFYTQGTYYKRVIFPGGFVVSGSKIYLAYGKDDTEMWIATLDLAELKKAMVPVSVPQTE